MTPEQQSQFIDLCGAWAYVQYGHHSASRMAALETFVDSLIAAERAATVERCAQLCDAVQKWGANAAIKGTAHNLALAIRDLPKDANNG